MPNQPPRPPSFEAHLGAALELHRRGAVVLIQGPGANGMWLEDCVAPLGDCELFEVAENMAALLLPGLGLGQLWAVLEQLKISAPDGVQLGPATWPVQASSPMGLMAEAAAALADASSHRVKHAEELSLEFEGEPSEFNSASDFLTA